MAERGLAMLGYADPGFESFRVHEPQPPMPKPDPALDDRVQQSAAGPTRLGGVRFAGVWDPVTCRLWKQAAFPGSAPAQREPAVLVMERGRIVAVIAGHRAHILAAPVPVRNPRFLFLGAAYRVASAPSLRALLSSRRRVVYRSFAAQTQFFTRLQQSQGALVFTPPWLRSARYTVVKPLSRREHVWVGPLFAGSRCIGAVSSRLVVRRGAGRAFAGDPFALPVHLCPF
jgi:hypothetical protein